MIYFSESGIQELQTLVNQVMPFLCSDDAEILWTIYSEITRTQEDNLKHKTIKEIWESGAKFQELRNLPGNPACQNCNYYGICRGGCMARNLFFEKDINLPDPWCIRKYFPIRL